MDYKNKYLKYKQKYLELKYNQKGSAMCLKYGLQQHHGECWHDSLSMLILQSNITSDIFIQNIRKINLDHKKILDKFSIDNLLNNAFLLPTLFYDFYLTNIDAISKKDVTAKKIYKYFEDFFKLSIQYINDQKERVINRLDHDEDLKRYEMTDIRTLYPEGVNEIKQQLYSQYEYNPMYNYNAYFEKDVEKEIMRQKEEYMEKSKSDRFKLQKQKSIEKSISCSNTLLQINQIIFSLQGKQKGGLIEDILLGIDILNLFIFNLDIPKIYFTNTIYICNEIYKKHELFINDLENPNLVGYELSIKTHQGSGHAVCIYKCNDSYLLYDDNFNGPISINWFEYLRTKEFTPETKLYYYSNESIIKEVLFNNADKTNDTIKLYLDEKIKKNINYVFDVLDYNYKTLNFRQQYDYEMIKKRYKESQQQVVQEDDLTKLIILSKPFFEEYNFTEIKWEIITLTPIIKHEYDKEHPEADMIINKYMSNKNEILPDKLKKRYISLKNLDTLDKIKTEIIMIINKYKNFNLKFVKTFIEDKKEYNEIKKKYLKNVQM
jgi:hypothetical protein